MKTPWWFQQVKRNQGLLQAKVIVPEPAPNMMERVKYLEGQINHKDMAIDAPLIENEQLKEIITERDNAVVRTFKLRRFAQ